LVVICRILVGSLFLVAGGHKLVGNVSYASIIELVVGAGTLAGVLIALLPIIEIAIGLLLLVGISQRQSFVSAIVLLATFTIALVYSSDAIPGADCGCGLPLEASVSVAIVRNLVLILVAIAGFVLVAPTAEDSDLCPS